MPAERLSLLLTPRALPASLPGRRNYLRHK